MGVGSPLCFPRPLQSCPRSSGERFLRFPRCMYLVGIGVTHLLKPILLGRDPLLQTLVTSALCYGGLQTACRMSDGRGGSGLSLVCPGLSSQSAVSWRLGEQPLQRAQLFLSLRHSRSPAMLKRLHLRLVARQLASTSACRVAEIHRYQGKLSPPISPNSPPRSHFSGILLGVSQQAESKRSDVSLCPPAWLRR